LKIVSDTADSVNVTGVAMLGSASLLQTHTFAWQAPASSVSATGLLDPPGVVPLSRSNDSHGMSVASSQGSGSAMTRPVSSAWFCTAPIRVG
jgi:hypothetical protein